MLFEDHSNESLVSISPDQQLPSVWRKNNNQTDQLIKSKPIYQSTDQLGSVQDMTSSVDYIDTKNVQLNEQSYMSHRIPTRELKRRQDAHSKQAQQKVLNHSKYGYNKNLQTQHQYMTSSTHKKQTGLVRGPDFMFQSAETLLQHGCEDETNDANTNDLSIQDLKGEGAQNPYLNRQPQPLRKSMMAHSTKHQNQLQTFTSSNRRGSKRSSTVSKDSVTMFDTVRERPARLGSVKDEQDSRYQLSRISSGFSEREVIAMLVKKHQQNQGTRQEPGRPPVTLANVWQPWLQWDNNPREPVSEYQQIYDNGAKFTESEIKRVAKNPLWKNMSIIQNAMARTASQFTPTLRRQSFEESRYSMTKSKTSLQKGKITLRQKTQSPTRRTPVQSGEKGDANSLTILPQITNKNREADQIIGMEKRGTKSQSRMESKTKGSQSVLDKTLGTPSVSRVIPTISSGETLNVEVALKDQSVETLSETLKTGNQTPTSGVSRTSTKTKSLEQSKHKTCTGSKAASKSLLKQKAELQINLQVDTESESEGAFSGIMQVFAKDYNEPAKIQFFKRLPDQMAIFQRQRFRNKEFNAIQQLEEKHRRGIFKQPFDNQKLLHEGKRDSLRIQIVDWLIKKFQVVMYNFNERNFKSTIADCGMICLVTKTLIDKNLLFYSHQVLGCLYLSMDMIREARQVFDLMKDVAEECHNWCQAMLAYEWIGRTLHAAHDYENAIKAFKKMMQLSWVTGVPEYEVKSFHCLAKQYFYLQYIEKSSFYSMRFIRGMLENPASCQRTIAEQLFHNKLHMSGKTNKYEREGFRLHRLEENKFIDCTENYENAFKIITDSGELQRRGSNDIDGMLFRRESRRVGGKLVRLGTPVENVHPTLTQSPSNNKADMMLLPGFSLADQENDAKAQNEGMTRSAQNMKDKQVSKSNANATSGPGSQTQKILNRMNKPAVTKIDYLSTLRKEREQKESLKGDYSIDIQKIRQKAKTKKNITTKQQAFLTHLRDETHLNLMRDMATQNPKEANNMKSKSKGKEATMKELEAVKRQRIAQKRFMKTEVVSKELMHYSYSLLEHLQKMRKTCYVSESAKAGKYQTTVVIRYMSTKSGKQIHELEEFSNEALSQAGTSANATHN